MKQKYIVKAKDKHFLGALAELRRASVRPSVRMEQIGSQWTDFH